MIFFQSSLKPASTRNVSQNEGRLLPLWINETLQFPSSARLSAAPFNDGLGYRYLLLQRGGTPGDPLGNGVPNAAVTTAAVLFDVLLILPKHFPPRSDVINDFRRSRLPNGLLLRPLSEKMTRLYRVIMSGYLVEYSREL
ncbi:hypothetical protein FIBSPDRAFT_939582 [Athelia psychrophila]|uniref:Uncharacterized protein n=1 Tax=Athelia psychrophila TaxID=1759441 RepID=A0A167XJ39_9AGAM|nr:hypothetical protein FIBSPDRAFT_939582 [Fibularhizoctonia sp. CBS 109695]